MTQTPRHKSNVHYLGEMVCFARLLRSSGHDPALWAAKGRYVRVNGAGLRPVSISKENPCGALRVTGGDSAGKVIRTRRTIDNLADILRDATHATRSPDGMELWQRKKEHRVQAWLITEALLRPDRLPAELHLDNVCDELRFVTDEIALNGIRADVILLARKGREWFPIFIELKAGRDLKVVIGQLESIARLVAAEDVREVFRELLSACTDVSASAIRIEHARRMVIWARPKGQPSRELASRLGDALVREFNPDIFSKPPDAFQVRLDPYLPTR